jgi:hypothetical protein
VEGLTSDLSDEAIAAIADPLERAARLRLIVRNRGTLTPGQSRVYRQTIAELRGDDEREHGWIARRIGISRGRISQILKAAKAELGGVA